MNLAAIRRELVGACQEQGLSLYADVPTSPNLPALYCGMPTEMREWSSPGSCTMDISLVLCVSRADEDVAQTQLSDILSTLKIVHSILNAPRTYWVEVAFVSINNFRGAVFGETTNVLACDLNFQIRTK